MLLAIVLAIVRQHVDDEEAAAGLEDAGRLGERPRRIGHVMQHQHEQRRGRPRRRRSAALRARPAAARRAAGDDASAAASIAADASTPMTRRDERRDQRGDVAGAAAEIGDDPVGIEQAEHALAGVDGAEELVAQAVPLAGRAGEERLRGGAPSVEHAGQRRASAAPPGPSRPGRGRPARALRRLGQRRGIHGVEAAGALAARGHPAAVRQRLQVPADGRLRQPQHLAQLGDRQLVRFEHSSTRTRMASESTASWSRMGAVTGDGSQWR